MLRYLDKLKFEDMNALIRKKETQKTVLQEVAKANEVREYIRTNSNAAVFFTSFTNVWRSGDQ